MATIAEAAAAALEQKRAQEAAEEQQRRDTLVSIVRNAIATTLAPLDAAGLDVVHADLDAYIAVLTDHDVCLAGTDDGLVYLVVDADGWTRQSPPLRSLAHLGEMLVGA